MQELSYREANWLLALCSSGDVEQQQAGKPSCGKCDAFFFRQTHKLQPSFFFNYLAVDTFQLPQLFLELSSIPGLWNPNIPDFITNLTH